MKIAIHKIVGSFSDRWIAYCEENQIDFKIVNCYDSDIMNQLENCEGLMWHWSHEDYKAALFARQLTISLEKKGIKVFPDTNTSWHFDDKIGQKYLLEAIGAPLVKSYVFYSKSDALDWINRATFPKVFKLRGGASSVNVRLIKTSRKAKALVNKAFGNGFSSSNPYSGFKNRLWVLRRDRNFKALKRAIRGIGRFFIPTEFARFAPNQKGYVYFQDFIPNNKYDSRLIVIGNRCLGVRRYTRTGDFRASGSGLPAYDPKLFNLKSIRIAFDIAKKLQAQSLAMDFIMDGDEPKVMEISYGFITGEFYDSCPGYWDSQLNWYQATVNPQYFIIEDFIEDLKERKKHL